MPHLFRTPDGRLGKASQAIPLFLADGTLVTSIWGGSAQQEKLKWWLEKPGNELLQSEVVSGVAVRDDDTNEIRWCEAPAGARLLFVLEPLGTGKTGEAYRIAKMITVAATPAQAAYFRDERFALLGTLDANGAITTMTPPPPPEPKPPAKGELF